MSTKLRTRNDFAAILNEMGLTIYAAEIGVAEGYHSHALLDHWPGRCWQIDPWRVLTTSGYSLHGETDQEARYQRMLKASQRYNGRCTVKRATSEEAAPDFPDDLFDFVYIDAIHTRESSAQDIALWWPKVKSGGILAGHDYLNGLYHGQLYGVKTSVDEFAAANGLTVTVTTDDEWPSWMVVKP